MTASIKIIPPIYFSESDFLPLVWGRRPFTLEIYWLVNIRSPESHLLMHRILVLERGTYLRIERVLALPTQQLAYYGIWHLVIIEDFDRITGLSLASLVFPIDAMKMRSFINDWNHANPVCAKHQCQIRRSLLLGVKLWLDTSSIEVVRVEVSKE